MKLYMPTKVYQEKKCVDNNSRELAALGTRALIVTGKHSSRINGSLDDVKNALDREKIPYTCLLYTSQPAFRISFPAASARESALRGRWPPIRNRCV